MADSQQPDLQQTACHLLQLAWADNYPSMSVPKRIKRNLIKPELMSILHGRHNGHHERGGAGRSPGNRRDFRAQQLHDHSPVHAHALWHDREFRGFLCSGPDVRYRSRFDAWQFDLPPDAAIGCVTAMFDRSVTRNLVRVDEVV